VAITARAIATGKSAPTTRKTRWPAARAMVIPTSRSQPKCRLGKAAYSLVSDGGCSAR
jgi:hypothetical protein